jgi:mycothione reductase
MIRKGENMKQYDVIVIGSGSGLTIAYKALSEGMKVALVAREYLGGTCMNVGCVPSKTLLYAADMVMQTRKLKEIGLHIKALSVDFPAIMKRVRETRQRGVDFLRKDLRESENLDFYESEAEFIDEYTLATAGEKIRGGKIFIASGARPLIPPIKGLTDIPCLTNESLLLLDELPKSLIIIGGSYIGVEYAHFFAGMGCAVTVVEYSDRLVAFEEPEMSELLTKSLAKRMAILTNSEATEAVRKDGTCVVTVKERATSKEIRVEGAKVLVAAGRKSNADRLKPEKTGVELTKNGFISVDDYLQTSKPNIWAIGDATGRAMFTHAADHETGIVWHNSRNATGKKMNFNAVPHAVFTMPQIASIGLTEAEAAKGHEILVGRADYADTTQSDVRMETEGFAKAIVEKGTEQILGFHIIGPDAAILIQEPATVMAAGGTFRMIMEAMHIFPAPTELIPNALKSLE